MLGYELYEAEAKGKEENTGSNAELSFIASVTCLSLEAIGKLQED